MSLYIRVHLSFWNHRKTLRLKSKLGDAALWLPPRLWAYAAANQPDGDFSDYKPEEIAMLLGYEGDASSMLQALQQSGFLDDMRIHDWSEHNAFHEFYQARAKKAAEARWGKKKRRKNSTKEEKIREEQALLDDKRSNASSIPTLIPEALRLTKGFSEEWQFFLEHRKSKRAPMTKHAQELILAILAERPADAIDAVKTAIIRNWTGIKWDWYDNTKFHNGANGTPPWQSAAERKQAEIDAANREYRERKRREGRV